MTDNNATFNDAISLLKKSAETRGYNIWIPSLKQDVKFKPLNTLHHKKFVKILMDTSMFNTALNLHVYDIIKQTCLDESVNVDTLDIFDRIAICYAIRKQNFKKKYVIALDEKEDREISFTQLLAKFKKGYKRIEPDSVTEGDVTINVSLPSLKREREFDNYIYNKHLINFDKNNNEQLNQIFADLMLFGTIQYIDSIQVGETLINIDGMRTDQKVELLSAFDAILTTKISTYIKKCNDQRVALCSVDVLNGKDETQTVEISIDSSFFIDE